eukprot:PhM_4_TR8785/c0_g1_i1/m.49481
MMITYKRGQRSSVHCTNNTYPSLCDATNNICLLSCRYLVHNNQLWAVVLHGLNKDTVLLCAARNLEPADASKQWQRRIVVSKNLIRSVDNHNTHPSMATAARESREEVTKNCRLAHIWGRYDQNTLTECKVR